MYFYVDGSYNIGKNKSSIGLVIKENLSLINKSNDLYICKRLKKNKYTNSLFTEEFAMLFALKLVEKQYKDKKTITIFSDNIKLINEINKNKLLKTSNFTLINEIIKIKRNLEKSKSIHILYVNRKLNPAHISATFENDFNISKIHIEIYDFIFDLINKYKNLEKERKKN